ncbi:MAG: nitroreductase family protein [Bacillota bacterium]
MTKDVIDAIRERRSVHRFESRPVPEATVGRILECARLAPSVANSEPWLFVVVQREEERRALSRLAPGEEYVVEAPVIVVVCSDVERAAQAAGLTGPFRADKARLLGLQDAAAAIENMLLAATGFGLGSCWVGDIDPQRVAERLGLDANRYQPVAMVPLGYARDWPAPPERRPIDDMVRIIQ